MLKPALKVGSYTPPGQCIRLQAIYALKETISDNFLIWRTSIPFCPSGDVWPRFQNQGWSPYLHFSFSVCNGFLRFTYGVTTADLLNTRKMQCYEIHYELLMRLSRTNQDWGKFDIRSQRTKHYVAFSDCQDTFLLRC